MNTGPSGVFGRNQNFGLHAGSLQGLKPTRRLVFAPSRSLTSFRVHAKLDPYKTLGVSPNASEKEIKRAHRKLVLKHHPDLAKGEEGIEVKFLAIQEAYEILIGKRRGKEESDRPAGWDFHDWYWSFSMKQRRKGSRAAGAPPPEATRQNWRQQMAGLREKAAKKAESAPRGRPGSAAHAKDARPRNPTEAAASSVWRSTTKNARKSHAETAKRNAFAAESSKSGPQHLRAEAQAAMAAPAVEKEEQQPVASAASSMVGSSNDVEAAAAEPLHAAGPAVAPSSTSTSAATAEQKAWRSLLTRAVQRVHDLRHRHEASVHTHAQKIQSHIASLGEKFHRRLQAEAFSMFVPNLGDLPGVNEPQLSWRGMRGFNGTSHGIPPENELHMLFGEAVRSMHSIQEAEEAVNASAAGATGSYSYPMDNHSRKFADKEHVKSRLSNQLTGLKRRAAMKREFEK